MSSGEFRVFPWTLSVLSGEVWQRPVLSDGDSDSVTFHAHHEIFEHFSSGVLASLLLCRCPKCGDGRGLAAPISILPFLVDRYRPMPASEITDVMLHCTLPSLASGCKPRPGTGPGPAAAVAAGLACQRSSQVVVARRCTGVARDETGSGRISAAPLDHTPWCPCGFPTSTTTEPRL